MSSKLYPKAVVVMAGARDRYQLPLALYEGDLLQTLVTEMYWPADKKWFSSLAGSFLPNQLVSARFCERLGSDKVKISAKALGTFALMKVIPGLNLNRYKDKTLSKKAKRLAVKSDAALFCYSYYASEAFRSIGEPLKYRFIFQLHPHPKSVRTLLLEEVERVPHAKSMLMREHELSLLPKDFDNLASEPQLANGWVVASRYTGQTLAEHGIPAEQIHVVPYGVDSRFFEPRLQPPDPEKPFTIIYVGSMIQRKGLSYLLDAVRLLASSSVRVLLCGRGLIDQELLSHYADVNVEVKIGLPTPQLVRELQGSDIFVLPSLTEGFAFVILEAMACGVPVITTAHTCGPDVMIDGEHGFIVPIRSAEAIAEKLAWALEHRAELAAMGQAAAVQSRLFTWERFRAGLREAYQKMLTYGK